MSENEEMYLVKIARSNEAGIDPVPLSILAQELNLQPVSANQMIKKLEEAGKVTYTPYKGVSLTYAGKMEAARVLRNRRLWEVFLAEYLGFAPIEADEIACRLEHVVNETVIERLSLFLGSPLTSPQGEPIPQPVQDEDQAMELDMPLSLLSAGSFVVVSGLPMTETEKAFLHRAGVRLGSKVEVLSIQSGGNCLIQPEAFPVLQVSASLADLIRVKLPFNV